MHAGIDGDEKTLTCVPEESRKRCLTLSIPVHWQSRLVACHSCTLQMMMLLCGWPTMVVHRGCTRQQQQQCNWPLGSTHPPTLCEIVSNWPRQWQCSAAGKVTVGLMSHWPCITHFAVFPPMGSTAEGREMSTQP